MERVVRRFFLLGTDSVTGMNYDHRKVWIEEQLNRLAFTTEPQRGTEKLLRFSKFVPFGSLLCVSVVRVVDRIAAGAGVGTAWYRRGHFRCAGQGVRQATMVPRRSSCLCGKKAVAIQDKRGHSLVEFLSILSEGLAQLQKRKPDTYLLYIAGSKSLSKSKTIPPYQCDRNAKRLYFEFDLDVVLDI